MVGTEIINFTSANVQVKEGTKDIITVKHVQPVEPKKAHHVKVDSNATYKIFTVGPETGEQKVEISSDYCSDNQIVYVRASQTNGILFKDPVPRGAKMAEKMIHNKTTETIVLREDVVQSQLVGSSEVDVLHPGGKKKWRVELEATHRTYFVELKRADSGVAAAVVATQIPRENFKDKKFPLQGKPITVTLSEGKLVIT